MALKPYLQLVRLPNVFTAAADSLAGWLIVAGSLERPGAWVPLVLASACTYAGGIALNDVFDVEVDRVERPSRPIPSGRIGRGTATILGAALMAAGLLLAILSGTRYGAIIETAVIVSVLLYDTAGKRSALGPEIMGACRGLNLLLGMSAAALLGGPVCWLAALAYGTFVAGVTWISRSEVEGKPSNDFIAGVSLQTLAICGLIAACLLVNHLPGRPPDGRQWAALAVMAFVGWLGLYARKVKAVFRHPDPRAVQGLVKFGIMSLVWLNAALVLAARGPGYAAAVALLWFPAAYAGRWIYST